MATSNWFAQNEQVLQQNNSAVINLTDSMMEGGELDAMATGPAYPEGEAPMSRTEVGDAQQQKVGAQEALLDAVKSQMAETVWQTGKQQARKVFDLYGNIDLLRPYFEVEPKTVLHRLALSVLPLRPSSSPQKAVGELYGPLMIVFTLIAILLMGMKDSGHTVREGTLMGSAIGVCFGYWFLASGLYYGVSFICNTHITFLQVLSLTGYGMFSFCVVLFLGTALHNNISHTMFYTIWAVLGGLSSLRMVCVYLSRTKGRSHKLTIAATVAALHLLFLLYLHFAYHKIVQEDVAIGHHRLPPHHDLPSQPLRKEQGAAQPTPPQNIALPADNLLKDPNKLPGGDNERPEGAGKQPPPKDGIQNQNQNEKQNQNQKEKQNQNQNQNEKQNEKQNQIAKETEEGEVEKAQDESEDNPDT